MIATYILPLNDPRATVATAGGKGAALSRLAAADLPVPSGFHITTAAYQRFVAENNLQTGILAALAPVDAAQPATLEMAAQTIQDLFAQATIPADIVAAIVQAYTALPGDNPPVAVRSSATAEDLPDLSFAGQLETFLNIQGVSAVQEAVKRCWASLWTGRVIGYRAQHDIALQSLSIAVVVQMLAPAEAAGILFTANPINGRRNQAVINATWGLGEVIVGGLVTPDTLIVDKATGRVLTRETGDKHVMTVRVVGGTETQPVPAARARAPVLADREAAELMHLGVQIEELFATPIDVEWTLADGTFAVVQARPITALPPEPVRWEPPMPGMWLRGGGIMEFITEPVSPFMETFVMPLVENTMYELGEQFGIADLFTWPMGRFVNGHIYGRLELHLRPHHALGFIRSVRTHMQSVQQWPAALQRYRTTVAALCRPEPTMLTARELEERMEGLILAGGRYWNHLGMIIRVIIDREGRFTTFYNRSIRRSGDPEPEIFLRGQENRPLEAERSVYALAQAARALPGVVDILSTTDRDVMEALADTAPGREFRQHLQTHLDRFGYQIASLDPLWPTLDNDPRPVLKAVQGYLAGQESPYARQRRMMTEQTVALAAIALRLSRQQRRKFRALLVNAQEMARLREDAMFELGLAWRPLYQCALELGRRIVETGALAAAEDIFWLTRAELQTVGAHLDADKKPDSLQDTVCER
ncbi:MAG: hypothetical protein MI924_33660, partial [Chloroflexales bacterium]|nr:hypothetical protein [Chloroflexales bacterium]